MVLLIHGGEDGLDDALDALDIGEDHQGSSAATNLDEAAFDGVGRTQRAPQVPVDFATLVWPLLIVS